MGGQACVLYGAAEFSRDIDIAIAAHPDDWDLLQRVLVELQADPIAVPPPSLDALRSGHALHYRLRDERWAGIRLDVMSTMRGVDTFDALWARRTTIAIEDVATVEVLALPDLVSAKKTQRDKDWPMVRRLVEAHYASWGNEETPDQVDFWLREARTPAILINLCQRHRGRADTVAVVRPLLHAAIGGDVEAVEAGLWSEEAAEREADRVYWRPLRAELESMRHAPRNLEHS